MCDAQLHNVANRHSLWPQPVCMQMLSRLLQMQSHSSIPFITLINTNIICTSKCDTSLLLIRVVFPSCLEQAQIEFVDSTIWLSDARQFNIHSRFKLFFSNVVQNCKLCSIVVLQNYNTQVPVITTNFSSFKNGRKWNNIITILTLILLYCKILNYLLHLF